MAENVTLNRVVTFTNDASAVNTVNSNYTTITNAFTDVLSRSGGSPNQMLATLDMNSNQIINLPPPSTINSPIRVADVTGGSTIVIPPTGTSGHVVPFLDGNNTWSGTNTFNGNVTISGGLSIGSFNNSTFTGTSTFNSTNTFSNTSTFNGSTIFNGSVAFNAGFTGSSFNNSTFTGTSSFTGSISSSSSNTWSNLNTFNGAANFNQQVTISPPTATSTGTAGLIYSQSLAGNNGGTSHIIGHHLTIPGDTSSITDTTHSAAGLRIDYNVGGTGTKGAHNGMICWSTLQAPADTTGNPQHDYVSGTFEMVSNNTDNQNASLWALGIGVSTGSFSGSDTSTTPFALSVGCECDMLITQGVPSIKAGYSVISQSGDAHQGSTYDAGFFVTTQTGGIGWQYGYQVNKQGGTGGVTSSGTCFGTKDNFTVLNGVDVSSVTISGSAFKSTSFSVNGVGVINSGSTSPANSGTLNLFGSSSGQSVIGVGSSGNLFLNTATNNAIVFNDGSNGSTLVLASIGAAIANQIAIVPAAAGIAPVVSCSGTDTNITNSIQGKGTGGVNIKGQTAATNAPAGYVGEYISASQTTPQNLTTGTSINLTSITLTPGDWEVWGSVGFTPAGSTVMIVSFGCISLSSASMTPAEANAGPSISGTTGTGVSIYFSLTPNRINVSSNTTVFLNSQGVFTTSTCTSTGFIKARRIR